MDFHLRKAIGAGVRELVVHLARPRGRPSEHRLLLLPSQGRDDGAANLRAYLLAENIRNLGWNAVVCPKHLSLGQRRRVAHAYRPDAILMQSARHPLNRPKYFTGTPVLFDIDDADYISPHSRDAVDECLRDAAAVVAGSNTVAAYCRSINPRVDVVWTGSPVSSKIPTPQGLRPLIVTWAASSPLGSPQEAEFLLKVLTQVSQVRTDFTFRLYADDKSLAYRQLVARFLPLGFRVETFGYLPYPRFLNSLDDVSIGLAPLIDLAGFSGGKSFGKVLAYLDRGVPVLTHPVVDHPLFFENGKSGIMATGVSEWVSHLCRLLDDAEERNRLACFGRAAFQDRLSIQKSALLVEGALRRMLGSPSDRAP